MEQVGISSRVRPGNGPAQQLLWHHRASPAHSVSQQMAIAVEVLSNALVTHIFYSETYFHKENILLRYRIAKVYFEEWGMVVILSMQMID